MFDFICTGILQWFSKRSQQGGSRENNLITTITSAGLVADERDTRCSIVRGCVVVWVSGNGCSTFRQENVRGRVHWEGGLQGKGCWEV